MTPHVSARADTLVTLLTGSRAVSTSGATTTDVVTASSSARFVIHSVLLTESTLTKPATCYSDSFANSTTFGQNWVTTSVGSTAFTPAVTNGRLRLTSNNGYISTAATLQRIFPTSNLIYVEFDYYAYPNANGADGVAVTLSDASITPQPGGFGGSLGYAQRNDSGGINGFAGGWVGVALDEYGNFSNPTEGRNGGPGFRVDSVAVRGSGSGLTGYPYLAGTAAGLSPGVDSSATPGPGHRYRIVIDAAAPGQTYVTVDRDTTGSGSSYANLIPTFNIESSASQATIPANLMLSFTGSTGGSSNTHEIGDLSVCATRINTAVQVDHFEFIHDNEGLTCEPETIHIRACANANCSTRMTVPVDITLTSGLGWVGGNTKTIPSSGELDVQLRRTTAGTAAFQITNSTPGAKPFANNICNGVTMVANSATALCNLPFVNAGLVFDVPNLIANKPSGPVRLRAVKSSGDANNSCVALLQNSEQSINFWSAYTTPNTGTRPVQLSATAGSNVFSSISGDPASPTAMNLTFDNNGETRFEALYNDAGLMALNARYNGSGDYAGLILNGSDSFASRPAGLCVQSTTPSLGKTNYDLCTANFHECSLFVAAGNPFNLSVSARAWESDSDTDICTNNSFTPNYIQNVPLTTQLIAPSGGFNGSLNPATAEITSNGIVTYNDMTQAEVGVFRFIATPPVYFGQSIPIGTSIEYGRFFPHHFAIPDGSSLTNRSTSCTTTTPAFTYIGETLRLRYQLNALNAHDVLTQNYQGVFGKFSTFDQMKTAAIAASPRTALTMSGTNFSASWDKGQGTITTSFSISKSATPVGPYINTAFGVLPADSDGVPTTTISTSTGVTSGPNLDINAPEETPIVYDRFQIGSATELRYGRLRLESVSGPANLPLAIPITAEYWNGAGFITNTADTDCTTIVIDENTVSLGPYSGELHDEETTRSDNSGFILNGRAPTLLQLSQPGNGNEGSVGVSLDISSWPWLQIDWDGDGDLDTNASATASFGTYRGSDRVIYWQEIQ